MPEACEALAPCSVASAQGRAFASVCSWRRRGNWWRFALGESNSSWWHARVAHHRTGTSLSYGERSL